MVQRSQRQFNQPYRQSRSKASYQARAVLRSRCVACSRLPAEVAGKHKKPVPRRFVALPRIKADFQTKRPRALSELSFPLLVDCFVFLPLPAPPEIFKG